MAAGTDANLGSELRFLGKTSPAVFRRTRGESFQGYTWHVSLKLPGYKLVSTEPLLMRGEKRPAMVELSKETQSICTVKPMNSINMAPKHAGGNLRFEVASRPRCHETHFEGKR